MTNKSKENYIRAIIPIDAFEVLKKVVLLHPRIKGA